MIDVALLRLIGLRMRFGINTGAALSTTVGEAKISQEQMTKDDATSRTDQAQPPGSTVTNMLTKI